MGARIKTFTERCYAFEKLYDKRFPGVVGHVSGTPAIIAS
jgi:hypothetical protein